MKKYMKYAFLIFFAILLVLSIIIIKPFLTAILSAAIVAYMSYPLNRRVNEKVKNRSLSAAIVLLVVIIFIGIFSAIIISEIYQEVGGFVARGDIMPSLEKKYCGDDSLLCLTNNYMVDFLSEPSTRSAIISSISKVSASLIISIPSLLLNLLIFIFTSFYLLKEGDILVKRALDLVPLKSYFKKILKKQTDDIFYSTVYGAIVVSLIQGFVGIIAFMVFETTESPFFWGMIIAVAALIPFIGTGVIWIPMGLFQVLTGYSTGSEDIMWKGIGFLIIGGMLISTIDNIIRPKIVGHRAGMHPLLILLGALGGIAMLGFIGVFVGPLILAFFISFLNVYWEEKSEIFEC